MKKMDNLIKYTVTLLILLRAQINSETVKTIPIPSTICDCEYTFKPVCGSDGLVYYNQCVLECSSKEYVNRGFNPILASKCTQCRCQNVDLPVCALDGSTYPNECELYCENKKRIDEEKPLIYLAYRTACLGSSCGCTTETSPVCGTDNILYRNRCIFDCAAKHADSKGYIPIGLKNVGACLNGCECPNKYEPVCGSDNLIYDNVCMLACENNRGSKNSDITVASINSCNICNCSSTLDPICGSDGILEPKTYINPCHLECVAKRLQNPYLKQINAGPCPDCYCTNANSPVCGTDKKTYRNPCKLRCTNLVDDNKEMVSVFHDGSCERNYCNCGYCPKQLQPMCGTDAVTYSNLCELNCNSDCNKKNSQPEIFLARRGPC